MRQEPPGDSFLCWDRGTKPEPTRTVVGGGEEGGQWRGRREQIGGGSRAGLGKWQGRRKWRGRRRGCTTHPALPCPGAAPAQRGGGGISRPHPRPGRSARLSLATAAAQTPCVAPATGGPVVSAAETAPAPLGSARLQHLLPPRPLRLTPGSSSPRRQHPGRSSSASPPPPQDEPIRPGTAPRVTSRHRLPPRSPSLGKACLPRPGIHGPAGPRPGLARLVLHLPFPTLRGPRLTPGKQRVKLEEGNPRK